MSKQLSLHPTPHPAPAPQVNNPKMKESVNMFIFQMRLCGLRSKYHFDGLLPGNL